MKASEEYRNRLINLDKILKDLEFHRDLESAQSVLNRCGIVYNPFYRDEFIGELKDKGFVTTSIDTVSYDIQITPKGLNFIGRGGYIFELTREEELEELNIKVANSTIRTNKYNKRYTIINSIFFILNLILAYLTYIKSK